MTVVCRPPKRGQLIHDRLIRITTMRPCQTDTYTPDRTSQHRQDAQTAAPLPRPRTIFYERRQNSDGTHKNAWKRFRNCVDLSTSTAADLQQGPLQIWSSTSGFFASVWRLKYDGFAIQRRLWRSGAASVTVEPLTTTAISDASRLYCHDSEPRIPS